MKVRAFGDCETDMSLEEFFINLREGTLEGDGWEAFYKKLRHQFDHSDVHPLMQRLRQLVNSYDERLLLGETSEIAYYGNGKDELHSVFNFSLISKLDAALLRESLTKRLPMLPDGAWESNTVGNHDRARSYTYYSDQKHDQLRARMALAMVMFLRGTPTFYYGEEIGMRDAPQPTAVEQFKDGLGVWYYRTLRQRGVTHEKALQSAADYFCRDRCRTPMQWNHDANAGFSPPHVSTWLPVNTDYRQGVNVAQQLILR